MQLRKFIHLLFLAFLLLAALSGWAQKSKTKSQSVQQPWVTKDWREWNEEDCETVLTNSAWASSEKHCADAYVGSRRETYCSIGGFTDWFWGTIQPCTEQNVDMYVNRCASNSIRLQSALPIRHALARQLQLALLYLEPDAKDVDALDRQIETELARSYDDEIILQVTSENDTYGPSVVLVLSDGRQFLPIRKTFFYSNSLKLSYEAVFPRQKSGRPLVKDGDRRFQFMFGWPEPRAKVPTMFVRETKTFYLDAMKYQGKVEF